MFSKTYHPLPPPPPNHTSSRPTSVAVGVFSTLLLLFVLGVFEVGCVPMTSLTTPVYSALSIVSARSSIIDVPVYLVSVVYFSAYSDYILLITATKLALPSEKVSLIARPIVIEEADVVRLHLSMEGFL